jgi:hypothetical protein
MHFTILLCNFAILLCTFRILPCTFTILLCTFTILPCTFTILLCNFVILLCTFRILPCTFTILLCNFAILLCGFRILRQSRETFFSPPLYDLPLFFTVKAFTKKHSTRTYFFVFCFLLYPLRRYTSPLFSLQLKFSVQ